MKENIGTGVFFNSETIEANFRLEGVVKETDIVLSLLTDMKNILSGLEKPTDLDSFVIFKDEINKSINHFFSYALKGETENFKLSFSASDINFLIDDDSTKERLEDLLIKKQEVYNLYLSQAIKYSILDSLFNEVDLNTLDNLLKSKYFEYFNKLHKTFKNDLYEGKNKDYIHPENEGLKYGGLVDGKIVPYKDLVSLESIDFNNYLNNISNGNFHSYFLKLKSLLKTGDMTFEHWEKAENYAIDSWEDKNSKLSLNTSIETYIKANVLVDPELEVFLTQEDDENKMKAYDLSIKYYGDNYNIGDIKFYVAEPILSAGEVAFSSILGKSFPNSPKLTEERGTFIYSIKSRLGDRMLKKSQIFVDKLGLSNIDSKEFSKFSINHVAFHEYGHSLFIKGNNKSKLEETKASLFYYLHLFEENLENEQSDEYIKNFLDFLVIEAARKIKNKDNPKYEQYVIREKFLLKGLFESGLLYWNNEGNIGSNPNNIMFNNFLSKMKDLLDAINSIYIDDENGNKMENQLLDDVDLYTSKFIETIYSKIVSN